MLSLENSSKILTQLASGNYRSSVDNIPQRTPSASDIQSLHKVMYAFPTDVENMVKVMARHNDLSLSLAVDSCIDH